MSYVVPAKSIPQIDIALFERDFFDGAQFLERYFQYGCAGLGKHQMDEAGVPRRHIASAIDHH